MSNPSPLPVRVALVSGVALIVFSIVVPFVSTADAHTITGLVWGALLVTVSLVLQSRSEQRQLDQAYRLARLEADREDADARRKLLERVLAEGLPDGLSEEWVERMLRGDEEADGDGDREEGSAGVRGESRRTQDRNGR